MKIEIDYNPTPKNSFFISIPINEKEDVCFDNTSKRVGIIKQIVIEEKSIPANTKIDEQWETIVLEDRKFIEKFTVNWIDKGEIDWCNGKVFKCVWEKHLSNKLKEQLLYYSRLVCDNYNNLDKFSNELINFENLLKNELVKYS